MVLVTLNNFIVVSILLSKSSDVFIQIFSIIESRQIWNNGSNLGIF